MATLLISAAVNIAVGLALNALFPPPDVEQEGPRLTELGFTSAAYGKFVNIIFGTDRVSGNIIDTQDPVIEEVVTEESQEAGKGGGQTVTTTTYDYFFTGRVAFSIEGAADLIQLYGDGKLIYDTTGTGQLLRDGVTLRFDRGGRSQLQDTEEVGRAGRSASNQPAYRHLTSIKLDRLPLADFGNRIPNFTAVIAYDSTVSVPFIGMSEPAGLDVPGSPTGADVSRMAFDPFRNIFISLKTGGDSTWSADASTLQFRKLIGSGGFGSPAYGFKGFVFTQTGFANAGPLQKKDADTGVVVAQSGGSGIGLTDTSAPNYGNSGSWWELTSTLPGIGQFSTVFHFCGFGSPNGSVTDGDSLAYLETLSTAQGFPAQVINAVGLPDHDRARFFAFCVDTGNNQYKLLKYEPNFVVGVGGGTQTLGTWTTVRTFTRGSTSDDFNGTGGPQGWAINRTTGDLILCNGSTMILYNPDTDQILATRHGNVEGFRGWFNYYSGSLFGWMHGSTTPSASRLYVIDTRTLETIREESNIGSLIGWPGAPNSVIHDPSQVWDDRVQAIFLSRVDAGDVSTNPNRVIKVFVNRVNGNGVGLDFVVDKLCSEYHNITMADLDPADYDVTTLAGDLVEGYTINNKSTIRSAIEPLRKRFFFDGIQSDWKIKFPKRGGAAVTTIPEEFVGILKRGADETEEPPIQEVRTQDIELPMRVNVRYKNVDSDYDVDIEHDKRHRLPTPTMSSRSEMTIDIPIAERAAAMKPVAQNWLWTLWNERRQFKSIVPWEYLALDPTDIVNVGAFGETLRLRLTQMDVGAGFGMDLVGVAEDQFTFASTIGAGTSLGRPANQVPSSLPTRLLLLDAPLLSLADLLVTPVSNAYVAMNGFEPTWPGAAAMKSDDNATFVATATSNTQAAMAKVITPPPAEVFSNGNPRNRIIEVAEGGSMTIVPLNRNAVWATATELAMLNGANAFAVVYPTGEVQVLQYVTAVDNGDNTITLERLFMGRLGTEDISTLAIPIGSQLVLLSDSTGVKETSAIQRQRLALSELGSELFFRAVTTGTLLEDAVSQTYTYTGRDIKPYFPTAIKATPDGAGGLDFTWENRTRGPSAGELIDGTGTVPLNEQIEQYEVTLSTAGVPDFITKIVNNLKTVNFTAAELALGGTAGGFGPGTNWAVPDANFPTGIDPDSAGNWVLHQGGVTQFDTVTSGVVPSGPPAANTGGTGYLMYRVSNTSTVTHAFRQEVTLASLGIDLNSVADATFFLNAWCAQDRADGGVQFGIQLLDDSNTVLAQAFTGERDIGASFGVSYGDWVQLGSAPGTVYNGVPCSFAGVAGGTKIRVFVYCFKRGTLFSTDRSYYDEMTLEIVVPPPGITAKIVQVSDTGLKSPIGERQVT